VSLAFIAPGLDVLITGVAFIIFAFVGGEWSNGGEAFNFGGLSGLLQGLVFVVFLLVFVLIWFVLYIQYNREAEDIYSRLRQKLVGKWEAKYELYPGRNQHNPYD
jgi:uncharacterized membrane protein